VTLARSERDEEKQTNTPMSCSARAWVQPRSRTAKFGSANSRSAGSDKMNATDSERWVTSDLACWLTTYPVFLIARFTASRVPGDT
jgi:hypothetical protein